MLLGRKSGHHSIFNNVPLKNPFYMHFRAAQGVDGWQVVGVMKGRLSRATALPP